MGARKEKELKVTEIKEKLGKSQSVVFTNYRGLDVAQLTDLRKRLRESEVEYQVVKNTLTRRAVSELGIKDLDDYLDGPTAIAFGYKDPVAPAKVLAGFAKTNENLVIKGGILEGNVVTDIKVKELASLPSREELLAKVAAGLQSPLYGFATVLQANLRNLVNVVEAIREEKEKSA